MPIYPYACVSCDHGFEIIKAVDEMQNPESCPKCGTAEARRCIARPNIDKESCGQPYYEPALGMVVKSKGHKAQILKARGLEEVGNTSPDTMYKDLEAQREKRLNQKWDAL